MSGLELIPIEIPSGEIVLGTKVRDKLYLALPSSPTEDLDERYVRLVKEAVKDLQKYGQILSAANTNKQHLLRLKTDPEEKPWWAPLMVHKGVFEETEQQKTDLVVAVLQKEPTVINHC